jgi:hypothetical protein
LLPDAATARRAAAIETAPLHSIDVAIYFPLASYNRHRTCLIRELKQTMNRPTQASWRPRLFLTGLAGILTIGAVAALPSPAQAFWIGVGGPWGYYGPGPYYGYPPPYYYAPPPSAYYPPPGYSAPGAPAPAAPSAYTPQQPAYPPSAQPAYPPSAQPATPTPSAAITYTNKPAFTNAAGQTCRQYTTNSGGQPVYGTACQQADGQWRVAN